MPAIGRDEIRSLRRLRWREAALIAVLALTLNVTGNGRTSLWDRDEPRYAGCTREMSARGDWIYPTFNAEPRFHKPILIYWLMRVGFMIGGDNPFGARLVSALAGTCTSLLVLALGRRMFGPRAGFLAALMLTTAPIMIIESKLATTDATLAMFVVGCQFCLWELSRKPSKLLAAMFWVLLALATLTKGPVGLALIASAGVVSWWSSGSTVIWRRLNWRWGMALFVLATAPWYITVGIVSHGDFFRFSLGKQVAERVVSGMEQHGGFPGYYLVTSLVTFHPWSALLPAAILGAWSRRRADPDCGFLLGWIFGPLILLECVQTKLVHYYLPAYPACALLTARLVEAVARDEVNLRRWPLGRLGLSLIGGVAIGLTALFAALAIVFPATLRGPCLTTALVIGSGTLWGMIQLQRAATDRAVVGFSATWALTLLILFGWLLPAAEPFRTSRVVGERLALLSHEFAASPLLLSFQEPAVVYTMGRSAPLIRTWDRFYSEIDRHGAIVTAMIPREVAEFERRRDHLDVDYRETVEGFNLNKGETQKLWLAVIRRKPAPASAPAPRSDEAVSRASREQIIID
jgi:4-amino-4-deoxy-L-arabinose transferase-like glycosyltransferase